MIGEQQLMLQMPWGVARLEVTLQNASIMSSFILLSSLPDRGNNIMITTIFENLMYGEKYRSDLQICSLTWYILSSFSLSASLEGICCSAEESDWPEAGSMVSATRLTISSPSVEGSPLPSALGFSMDFSSSALAAEAGTEAEMRLVVVAASLSTETVTVAPDNRLFLVPEGSIIISCEKSSTLILKNCPWNCFK